MNFTDDAAMHLLAPPLPSASHKAGQDLHFGVLGRCQHDDPVVGEIPAIVKGAWVTEIARRPQLRREAQTVSVMKLAHRRLGSFAILRLLRVDSEPQPAVDRLPLIVFSHLFDFDINRLMQLARRPLSNLSTPCYVRGNEYLLTARKSRQPIICHDRWLHLNRQRPYRKQCE